MERCDGGLLDDDRFHAWLNLVQAHSVVGSLIESRLDAAVVVEPVALARLALIVVAFAGNDIYAWKPGDSTTTTTSGVPGATRAVLGMMA